MRRRTCASRWSAAPLACAGSGALRARQRRRDPAKRVQDRRAHVLRPRLPQCDQDCGVTVEMRDREEAGRRHREQCILGIEILDGDGEDLARRRRLVPESLEVSLAERALPGEPLPSTIHVRLAHFVPTVTPGRLIANASTSSKLMPMAAASLHAHRYAYKQQRLHQLDHAPGMPGPSMAARGESQLARVDSRVPREPGRAPERVKRAPYQRWLRWQR